jgi:transposase-like protein
MVSNRFPLLNPMSANLPTAEQLEQFKADLATGATSRELCSKFDIDENTLRWWVQTAKFMYPIDLRPRTRDMSMEAISEMKAWYIENQATISELSERYQLSPYLKATQVLEELCITRNKRRPNAATAGGKKFAANKAGYESNRNIARSTSKVSKLMESAIREEEARRYEGGLSIADRSRALGLTKLDPHR